MQAVILAGGLATRMRPRTLTVPKAMLEVAGRPFIDWKLERLRACGFDDVVLCVAFLAEQVEAHVGDGARYGLRVRYANEGPTLLGTAGALRSAVEIPGGLADTFLVTYGDSYLPFDYAEPLRSLDAHDDCDGVMSVYRNEGRFDASNVRLDEAPHAWVRAYEKGTKDPAFDCIDYGAIALRRRVIATLPLGEPHDLAIVQRDLARAGLLRATLVGVRFFEIGSPDGLEALDAHLTSASRPKAP